jgi:hypothetical protein
MTSIVNHLDLEAKLALIRAHPDLGSKAKMAEASVQEQAGVVCLRASLSKEFPLYIDIIRLRPTNDYLWPLLPHLPLFQVIAL